MQVFISYKSEDRELARKVQQQIASWGYDTWFDQDNLPRGEHFREAINQGLESSDVVIGITTQAALVSNDVRAEWRYALNYGNQLILVSYGKVEVPVAFASAPQIDFTRNNKVDFQNLKKELDRIDSSLIDDGFIDTDTDVESRSKRPFILALLIAFLIVSAIVFISLEFSDIVPLPDVTKTATVTSTEALPTITPTPDE